MFEHFLPPHLNGPDFYFAAMGRSGSTMICNWLTLPPEQMVFIEPSFLDARNTRLLRIQLANFGMSVSDGQWDFEDSSAAKRFERIMAPRLRGKRWAWKEVLGSEHLAVIDQVAPPRVLISVRNILDVALSFFEKHRAQDNLHRFDDQWVADYCRRESAGLLALQSELQARSTPYTVIRYEDFTRSEASRNDVCAFLGWQGGGATDMHFDHFDRSFETERHGDAISPRHCQAAERSLGAAERALAHSIAEKCSKYQSTFGYI